MSSTPSSPSDRPLGRIERAILDQLTDRAVLTPRGTIVAALFPEVAGSGPRDQAWKRRRSSAEAMVSRAIQTLEAKGLLTRERNARTGRSFLTISGGETIPTWEQLARAEEDIAAHCRQRSAEWQELARRARDRAANLRAEHTHVTSEAERLDDLEQIARLDRAVS